MDKTQHIKEALRAIRADAQADIHTDEQALEAEVAASASLAAGVAIWLLSISGGILAALAFLSFITMSGLNRSAPGMTITAVMLIALALFLSRKYTKIVTDTFSITFYCLGYLVLGIGLRNWGWDANQNSVIFIAICALSLILTHHFVFSLVSLLIIHGSLLSLILSNKFYDLIFMYALLLAVALWFSCFKEAQLMRGIKLYQPLRLAVLLAFLSTLCLASLKDFIPVAGWLLPIAGIGVGLMLLAMSSKIIKLLMIDGRFAQFSVYAACLLLVVCCAKAPVIIGSLLAVFICFFVGFQSGTVLSLITLVFGVAQFFYELNLSLPQKSGVLCLTGLVFIVFYIITNKFLSSHEKV